MVRFLIAFEGKKNTCRFSPGESVHSVQESLILVYYDIHKNTHRSFESAKKCPVLKLSRWIIGGHKSEFQIMKVSKCLVIRR